MGSQLVDAPQGTQTQVHVSLATTTWFGDGRLAIQSPYVVYVLCRVRPNAHNEVKDKTCKDVPVIAPTSVVLISLRQIQAASVILESPSRLTLNLICELQACFVNHVPLLWTMVGLCPSLVEYVRHATTMSMICELCGKCELCWSCMKYVEYVNYVGPSSIYNHYY
jgi:hypothetical protein